MSEKWKFGGLDKFESGPDAEWEWCIESGDDLIATVPTGETESAAARAAEKPRAIAQQIAREHNAVPALVEALRECADLIEAMPASADHGLLGRQLNALDKARAALALAEEKP